MNTGREENAAIFRDTEKMCRTHPRLREAIAFSRAGQRVIPQGEELAHPGHRGCKRAFHW
jgi:hypothetical protein